MDFEGDLVFSVVVYYSPGLLVKERKVKSVEGHFLQGPDRLRNTLLS